MNFLIVFLLIIAVIIILFFIVLHLGFRAPRNRQTKTPSDFGIDFEEAFIPSISGKKLHSWLLPVEGSQETLVVLHGWGGNTELMMPLAIPFYKAGMNVLLIDSRSHGKSDSATFSSLPRFAEDLGMAIDWLKKEYPDLSENIAVLGHSVGAGAALFETSKRNDISAVISISTFAHAHWMMTRYLSSFHLPKFLIHIILSYVQWLIGHSFTTFAPLHTVCDIDAPILIVHGKDDTTIPIEDAHAIMKNCPKSHLELLEIDDAGHESVDKIEEHSGELVAFLKKAGFMVLMPS